MEGYAAVHGAIRRYWSVMPPAVCHVPVAMFMERLRSRTARVHVAIRRYWIVQTIAVDSRGLSRDRRLSRASVHV